MVVRTLLFVFLFLMAPEQGQATSTRTHHYIIQPYHVLVVNRFNDTRHKIHVQNVSAIAIHKDHGFFFTTDNSVEVYRLSDQAHCHCLSFIGHVNQMLIHDHTAYIADNTKVWIFDLEMKEPLKGLECSGRIRHLVHSNSKIYVFWRGDFNCVTEISNQKTVKTNYIDCNLDLATAIVCKENKAYVTSYLRKSLQIVDLHTGKRLKSIAIDHPTEITLLNNNLYIWQCTPTQGGYTVINLETGTIQSEQTLEIAPGHIFFKERVGFIYNDECTVIVYDLITQCTLANYFALRREDVLIIDGDLYFGTKKKVALNDFIKIPTLFDTPYAPLEGCLYEDGENAFCSFEGAILKKDHARARLFFDKALAAGHPKAYSLATFAFLMGRYGAHQDFHICSAFISGADKTYFNDLFQKDD